MSVNSSTATTTRVSDNQFSVIWAHTPGRKRHLKELQFIDSSPSTYRSGTESVGEQKLISGRGYNVSTYTRHGHKIELVDLDSDDTLKPVDPEEKENQPRPLPRQGDLQLRWRLGSVHRESRKRLPPRVTDGSSDPFAATTFPVDHFHHHLLPLLKRSYIFQHLQHVVPDHDQPHWVWIGDMVRRNIHGAYLFAYGLSQRVPNGTIPRKQHVRAHLNQALTTLRTGLEGSQYSQSLAELNVLVSGHEFYEGRLPEWRMHSSHTRDIVQKIGGMSKVSPVFRGLLLISAPVVCWRALSPTAFPSQDFDVTSWTDQPQSQEYSPVVFLAGVIRQDPELRALFQEHQEFLQVYQQYAISRNLSKLDSPAANAIQEWLDARFHVLNIISLETYFKLYKTNPDDMPETQRIRNQINGILILAASFCHQFIYHHTRTRYGLYGEHPLGSPLNTIAFMHLRSHLERLFGFAGYDASSDRVPVLWALFVLDCLEQAQAAQIARVIGTGLGWAASMFIDISRTGPPDLRDFGRLKLLFGQYLYSNTLDPFLATLVSGINQGLLQEPSRGSS